MVIVQNLLILSKNINQLKNNFKDRHSKGCLFYFKINFQKLLKVRKLLLHLYKKLKVQQNATFRS